jgi:hypothetical protein
VTVGNKLHQLLKVFQHFSRHCHHATEIKMKRATTVFAEMLKIVQESTWLIPESHYYTVNSGYKNLVTGNYC